MNYQFIAETLKDTINTAQQQRAACTDTQEQIALDTVILDACRELIKVLPNVTQTDTSSLQTQIHSLENEIMVAREQLAMLRDTTHQKKEAISCSTHALPTAHGCKTIAVKSDDDFRRFGNIVVKQQFGPFTKVYADTQHRGTCDAQDDDTHTWFRHIYRSPHPVLVPKGRNYRTVYQHKPADYRQFIRYLNTKLRTLNAIQPDLPRYYVLTNLALDAQHIGRIDEPANTQLVFWDARTLDTMLPRNWQNSIEFYGDEQHEFTY